MLLLVSRGQHDPVLSDLLLFLQLLACRSGMDWCLLRTPRQARLLRGHADGRWTLQLNDGSEHAVAWEQGMLATAWMLAGCLRSERRRYYLLATPCNSDAGARRQLAVRLRWTPLAQLQDPSRR